MRRSDYIAGKKFDKKPSNGPKGTFLISMAYFPEGTEMEDLVGGKVIISNKNLEVCTQVNMEYFSLNGDNVIDGFDKMLSKITKESL